MWPIDIRRPLSLFRKARPTPRRRPALRRPTACLRLEPLEERCLLSVNTTTHVPGGNIDASNLAGYQGETTIAINPTNPLNMVAGSNNLGPSSILGVTEAYWTKDGGNTWTAVDLGGEGDPGVVFDRAGNAYFSFIDSNFGIGVRKSTDGGVSWGPAVQVAASPGNGAAEDKPAITVGPDHANPANDRIYVGWDDEAIGDVLQVSSSGDGGATWTAPVAVDRQPDEIYAQPAVAADGTFYIAWDNFGTTNQSSIMFSRSTDDGSTFSTPVVAATSTVNLFNPSRYSIPAQPTRGIAADPSIAVEQSGPNAGRIYMTYTSAPTTHNDTNIYLIASDDGGATWTALGASPVKVNDDTTTNSQFFSALAIDPTNGTVNLAWYDARNDRKNQKVDVYFQSYTSAGVPSGANVKVTTAPSDESNPKTNNPNQYGDYMGIAAYGGLAFPTWTDHRVNKTGTEEIYVDPPLRIPGVANAIATSWRDEAKLALPQANSGASPALDAVRPIALAILGTPNNTTAPIANADLMEPALPPQTLSFGVSDSSTPASGPAITDGRSGPADSAGASTAQTLDILDGLFALLDAELSVDPGALAPRRTAVAHRHSHGALPEG
jgi:hypothetical protein